MGRRGLLSALIGVVLLAPGCGGDDGPTLTFGGSDEEQVAATVNAMTAAIAAGDGEIACALMTERGQRRMVRIGRQVSAGVDTCAAAVPAVAGFGYDPGDFRVSVRDVSIGPGPDHAQANCELRGGFLLERSAAGWRVDAPACVD
ncbi:MAG: hypothetical protein R2691_10980 [Solirubrobacterales bacterium]